MRSVRARGDRVHWTVLLGTLLSDLDGVELVLNLVSMSVALFFGAAGKGCMRWLALVLVLAGCSTMTREDGTTVLCRTRPEVRVTAGEVNYLDPFDILLTGVLRAPEIYNVAPACVR